jgi:hypothetical protein
VILHIFRVVPRARGQALSGSSVGLDRGPTSGEAPAYFAPMRLHFLTLTLTCLRPEVQYWPMVCGSFHLPHTSLTLGKSTASPADAESECHDQRESIRIF